MHLLMVALVFARLGLISFGAANLVEMEKQLVQVHGWISAATFVNGYALGQLVPGPNVLAILFYGYAHAGLPGALAATLGFFGPTAALAAAAALAWKAHAHRPWVLALRNALLPFGAGVLLATVLVLARGTLTSWPALLISSVALAVLLRFRVNAALVVLAAAVVGAVFSL